MQQHRVSRILKISSFVHSFSGSNRRVCSTHKKGQTGRKEALAPGNGIQPVSYAASLPGPTGARTPREGSGKNYIRKVTIWCRELTHWKRPWCWERLKAGGEGDDRGWGGWMASPTRWTWVWAHFGSWWWTGKPGMLQSMGSKSVRHDWGTELNWSENGTPLVVQWLRFHAPNTGGPGLVRELDATCSNKDLVHPNKYILKNQKAIK